MAIFHIYLCLHLRLKLHIAVEVVKEVQPEIYEVRGPKECKVARLWRDISVTTRDPRVGPAPRAIDIKGALLGCASCLHCAECTGVT